MATKPNSKKPANKPAAKKGAGCSLASIWEMTDPTEASNNLPLGEQKARLAAVRLNNDPEKGLAAFLKWEGMESENTEGLSSSQMYRLSDATGEKASGASYLMRDLGILGYPDIKPSKVEAKLKEIGEEGVVAIVNVKQSREYVNVYVQGLPVDADVDPDDEPKAAEEAEASGEVEVGAEITWEDGKKSYEGTVTKVVDSFVTVKRSDGKVIKLDTDDVAVSLKEVEPEPEPELEASEIEVGSMVKWEDDGDEKKGEVTKIKGSILYVEDSDGEISKVDRDDINVEIDNGDDEATETEKPEFEVGQNVTWEDDGDEKKGEIIKIKGTVLYIDDADGDTVKVDTDDVSVEIDD